MVVYKLNDITERTCNKCGTVHFAVTREHAENNVDQFNKFYDTAGYHVQQYYGRRATITSYEHCSKCGNTYLNFRLSKENECPIGCTLSPIIKTSNENIK